MARRVRRIVLDSLVFMIPAALLFATVALPDQSGSVAVENRTGETVEVWIQGQPAGTVRAGRQADFVPVPEGDVTLLATDPASGRLLATEHVRLTGGDGFTWILHPILDDQRGGTGGLAVTNGTDRTVIVSLGGSQAARLAPGASSVLPRLAAGSVSARATDESGRTVAERRLAIPVDDVIRWRIADRS